jgi:hypothetical protein
MKFEITTKDEKLINYIKCNFRGHNELELFGSPWRVTEISDSYGSRYSFAAQLESVESAQPIDRFEIWRN